MKSFNLTVETDIELIIDETRFTPEFLKEYAETIGGCHNLEDHLKNLSVLITRGQISSDRDFVEGYGVLRDFGVSFDVNGSEVIQYE